MRAKTSLILLLIVAWAAWAQTPATKAPAKAPAKTTAATPAQPAAAPAKPAPAKAVAVKPAPAKAAPAKAAPAKAAPAKAAPAKPSGVKAKAAPAVKKSPVRRARASKVKAQAVKPSVQSPAPTPPARKVSTPANRRDPFLSPVVNVVAARPCATGGKKCLAIQEIVLKGIAKTENGMLAMVENGARKAYILRENDPVFNGYVVKINMDSVVLRENVVDRLGHQSTRDITKRVTPLPVG